jgi:hypothetical protein
MLSAVITVGLLGLVGLGTWQVSVRYLATPTADRRPGTGRAVCATGGRRTELLAASAGRGLNLLILAVETVAVAVAIVTAGLVVLEPAVSVRRKVFVVLALLLGIAIIGDGMSVRLGFRGELQGPRAALASVTTPAVAETYTEIQHSLATTRGDGLDDVTVGVLAAATEYEDPRRLVQWGERTGVGTPEEFEARVDELVAAGLIEERNGRLRVGEVLDGADPARMATAAESVLR